MDTWKQQYSASHLSGDTFKESILQHSQGENTYVEGKVLHNTTGRRLLKGSKYSATQQKMAARHSRGGIFRKVFRNKAEKGC